MEKSKLLTILRSFSKQEIEAFTLFVESPYFNKNAAAVRLLKYLSKYHPSLEGTKVRKELVFKKIYPKDPAFKEKRLNDLMTVLLKLCSDFLSFNHFKQDSIARAQHQFAAYNEKGLQKNQGKAADRLYEEICARPTKEEYHFHQFLLNKELFLSQEEKKQERMQNALHHLELYYQNEKIFLAALAKNREKYSSERYDINTSNSPVKDKPENFQQAELFLKCIEIQNSENENNLQNLISKFKTQKTFLSPRKAHCLLIIILNILLRKYRIEGERIVPLIFDLYRLAVEKNFLTINNRVYPTVFINVCTMAAIMREREWLDTFIREYQGKIYPPEAKENVLNISTATVLYEGVKNSRNLKKIGEVIRKMNYLEFTDFAYTYKVKSMLIRLSYLEFSILKDFVSFDLILSACKAFESQMYRDTRTRQKRLQAFLAFSRFTKLLSTYVYEKKREKLIKLKEKIKKSKTVFAKKWLIEKTEEALEQASS